MKFINYIHISEVLGGYYIDPFEMDEEEHDRYVFSKLINALFRNGQDIFLFCSEKKSSNSLTIDKSPGFSDAIKLVDRSDRLSGRDQYCACFTYNAQESPAVLLGFWKGYKALTFFTPVPDLSWETFISYDNNLFHSDPDARRMFTFDFMNLVCIKGSGGESLSINHKKSYVLPDFEDIINGKFKFRK